MADVPSWQLPTMQVFHPQYIRVVGDWPLVFAAVFNLNGGLEAFLDTIKKQYKYGWVSSQFNPQLT